ncbi:MAG: DUF21 domain-containing protein [Verrucomicrobiota bacterium]
MTTSMLNWIFIPLCLLLSFWLSGMEAGVFALSRLRIRQQMRAGRSSARVLHQFLENPENFLWTIIVGNTLVNFVALGWFFGAVYGRIPLRSGWFVLWFILVVLVFYTFFDLLPKMLFRTYPNRLCLALARPFGVLHIGLRPLVAVVEWCAQMLRWTGGKRFRVTCSAVVRSCAWPRRIPSSVQHRGQAMIQSRARPGSLTVRQIAKPLVEAVTIPGENHARRRR